MRRLLPAGHWFFVLGLLVPMSVVGLFCQSYRDLHNGDSFGSLHWFDAMRSDFMFYLALIIFWIVVFATVRHRRSRRIAVFFFHLTFTLVSLLIVLTQIYYLLLDIMLNYDSIYLFKELFQVEMVKIIEAEAVGALPILALLLILLGNVYPAIMMKRLWHIGPRWLATPPDGLVDAPRRGVRFGACAVALVAGCLVLAALPNARGTTNFTRNRIMSVTMTALHGGDNHPPSGFVEPTRAAIPDHTHLVPTKKAHRYNIVMLVVESERSRASSWYNHSLDTTPNFDKLAGASLVGKHAYTVVPHTTKSLIASNCGVAPPLDTENTEAEPHGLAAKCLASLLNEKGYNTAFFQSATKNFENRAAVVKNFGYKHFFPLQSFDKEGFSSVNTLGYEDDIMLKPSLDWAGRQKRDKKPFLMTFMTVTSHYKYVIPKGYKTEHYSDDTEYNDYLNTVRYTDRFLGRLVKGFKKRGMYKNTIFVVMGDHGEGFREHGRRLHNDTIWNEGIQIPFLIHAPGRFQHGRVVTRPVQNMSVLPTLAQLLGYRIRGGKYHASSVLARRNKAPLVTSCWDQRQCIALIRGHRKYIHFFGYKPDEYFDLKKDPDEEHNLYDTLSNTRRQKLEHTVLTWLATVNATHELSRSGHD